MSQILWLVGTLGLVQLVSKIDLENETNQNYARLGFGVSTLFQLLVYVLIRQLVIRKKDTTRLRYTKPSSPFESMGRPDANSAVPETIITTNEEYDLEKVGEAIKQIAITACLISFLHYKYDFVRPLVLQSILPLKQVYSNPLVQIHLLKKAAAGSLARPFKQPSMFDALGGLSGAGASAQPAPAVSEAKPSSSKAAEKAKTLKEKQGDSADADTKKSK